MSVFELDAKGWDQRLADARLSSFDANEAMAPDFFEGVMGATGEGIMRGGAKVGDLFATAGKLFTPPAATEEEEQQRERTSDAADKLQDEIRQSSLDFWTPRANEVGTAGRVMGGLAEMVLPLGAAAGNPSVLIGSQTLSSGKDLVNQGVDATTAGGAAAIEGFGTYAGFKLPFLGKTLASKVLTGAGGNVALGAGMTAAEKELLESRGYDELAKNYDPMDAEARAVDLLAGVVFGGIAHAGSRFSVQDREAVAAANNAKHFQQDTAPGIPQTPAAEVAHQQAMQTAFEQLMRGDPVNIPEGLLREEFAPRPREPINQEIVREVFGEDIAEPHDLAPVSRAGAEMSPTEGKLLEKPLAELEQLRDIDENVKASLRDAYQRAARVKPKFDEAVQAIAAEVGAQERPLIAPLKGAARAAEKVVVDYGGDAKQLGDLVRATIVVDNIAQAQEALQLAIRRLGKPEKARDLLSAAGETLDGYRDINLKMRVDGQLVEVQVNVPEMLEAKGAMHKLYEERRSIQAKSEFTAEDDARITALDAQMKQRYAAAWNDFLRRSNSASSISTPSSRAALSEIERPSGTSNALTEKPPLAEGTVATGTPPTDQNTRSLPSGDISVSSDGSIPESKPQEVTKEYLKEHIDTRAVPDIQKMSKDPYAYVEKPAGTVEVPLKDIEFSKEGRVPDNALKRFAAAAAGEIPKREPPSVEALPDGRYKIVDGNGTVTALSAMGIDTIPVQVVKGAEQYGVRTVSTAAGRDLQVRPKLIELADAVTSDKANYPQELQPRQRGARVALSDQVRDIAAKLNPSRLVDSAEADRGAPITGEGNIVESGNGRVMALKYAYENIPEKAAEYRKYLESQGYDTKGMKQPILVRERLTPLDEAGRRAFTVEANQAATASLSPVEMAQADARILDSAVLSTMRGGDMAKAQNAEFVRAFLQRLPVGERNDMLNADGSINQKGVRRLQAALLAKAYGGKEQSNATLARMLESTDEDMRSAMGAMLDAAPAFARLRQAIADGKVSGDYDIAGQLTQAIENTARLRETGQSLHDFLAQQDAFTQRPPIVDDMMRMLYDKTGMRLASREKVAAKLTKYAGDASRQRLDQGSLFAEEPVAADKLVAGAAREAEAPAPKVTDMFGLRTPQTVATQAVKEMLTEADVQVPTGAIDAEGNPVTRSAREVMQEAEQGIAKAEADAKGYEAAVGCLLTRGFDNAA